MRSNLRGVVYFARLSIGGAFCLLARCQIRLGSQRPVNRGNRSKSSCSWRVSLWKESGEGLGWLGRG